jgi:multidrug resistance efflux pump
MNTIRELERPDLENGTAPLDVRVRSLRLEEKATGRSHGVLLPWALCCILLLTTTAFGYRAYRIGVLAPTLPSDNPPAASHVSVTTTTPVPPTADSEVVLQAKGYVVPAHQVQVSPKVGGMIERLNTRFEEGQFFKAGEPLAWLETDEYQAEYDRAVKACNAAEQRYEELKNGNRPQEIQASLNELREAEATFQQLDRDLRRNQRLMGSAALTEKDFEQAKFMRDSMKGRVDRLRFNYELMKIGPRDERRAAAKADWEAAQADVRRTKTRLDYCTIPAPISGHILTKKAEKGNVVNPLAFSISASLCEMADLGDLEIDLSIQERDIARVEEQQRCNVMPEAFQNHEPFRNNHPRGYNGRVIRLMPIADRSKGAINVRVKVEIPQDEVGKFLKPEMSVLVSFLKGNK